MSKFNDFYYESKDFTELTIEANLEPIKQGLSQLWQIAKQAKNSLLQSFMGRFKDIAEEFKKSLNSPEELIKFMENHKEEFRVAWNLLRPAMKTEAEMYRSPSVENMLDEGLFDVFNGKNKFVIMMAMLILGLSSTGMTADNVDKVFDDIKHKKAELVTQTIFKGFDLNKKADDVIRGAEKTAKNVEKGIENIPQEIQNKINELTADVEKIKPQIKMSEKDKKEYMDLGTEKLQDAKKFLKNLVDVAGGDVIKAKEKLKELLMKKMEQRGKSKEETEIEMKKSIDNLFKQHGYRET